MFPARTRATQLARETYARLCAAYPDATCALVHTDPFELLVAVVLSAQTTDVSVNRVMPALIKRYPDARALAGALPGDVEVLLRSIGMYRQKARNIIALSRKLCEQFDAQVPRTVPELISLPGVGRKTANVVLGSAFGIAEGVAVDTHVQRVTQRLGWTRQTDPVGIERDLIALLPRDSWIMSSHVLIFHGRRVCSARAPACQHCPVGDVCPSAHRAEEVGRKPARTRVKR
jgi:endonuclease-3